MEIFLPIKGIHKGTPVDKTPNLFSGDMENVRPRDVLENRLRIGQRPGLDKRFSQQISGTASPIVQLLTVTTVD